MKSKRNWPLLVLTIAGLALLVTGLVSVRYNWLSTWVALPYIMIGVGCGLFGYNGGEYLERMVIKRYPDEAKKIKIEQNDERNIVIAEKAKSKAYDAMVYIYGTVLLVLALMTVDLIIILLLVTAYLLVCGLAVYYTNKFHKTM
ncbi:MAG TPA: hypothetical protein VKY40_07745 [Halanaerobiales bacterium]|nr:hypothetical protein [Halanaerobiales bacterium]